MASASSTVEAPDALAAVMEVVGCDASQAAKLLELGAGSAQRALHLHYGQHEHPLKPDNDEQTLGTEDFYRMLPTPLDDYEQIPSDDYDLVYHDGSENYYGMLQSEMLSAIAAKRRKELADTYKLNEQFADESSLQLALTLIDLCKDDKAAECKAFLESEAFKNATDRMPRSKLLSGFFLSKSGSDYEQGTWPLFECAANEAYECAELLLEYGSPVDAPEVFGGDRVSFRRSAVVDSPLVLAASWGLVDLVELLLHHGADPFSLDTHGCTARECAEIAAEDEEFDERLEDLRLVQELLLEAEDAYQVGRGRPLATLCKCPHHQWQMARFGLTLASRLPEVAPTAQISLRPRPTSSTSAFDHGAYDVFVPSALPFVDAQPKSTAVSEAVPTESHPQATPGGEGGGQDQAIGATTPAAMPSSKALGKRKATSTVDMGPLPPRPPPR